MIERVLICRSNPIAPDPRVEKIARALVEGGYKVQLLGWDQTGQLPIQGDLDGIPFHRCRLPIKRVRGLWNLWYELRWQAALLSWLIKKRNSFDILHACDFDTVLPALLVKTIWQKKLVYDIFDFYADMLRFIPNVIKKIIRMIDLQAINRADAVILADDSRRQQISGSHPRRLEVIYNSPEDQSAFLTSDSTQQPRSGNLRIAYVGNLQIERGLLELIEVLRMHPHWMLNLAGFGGDEEKILSAASGMLNVIWHGLISYSKALQINFGADILIATYDPRISNNRYSSPNKLFEAMMLSKPIIVADSTNIDRIVQKLGCGIVVEYGDTPALEAALTLLQKNPAIREQYGRNAREAYDKFYSWSKMKTRLLHLYRELEG
jgi:glycosyltransferase involved in cell wall biosynthesis